MAKEVCGVFYLSNSDKAKHYWDNITFSETGNAQDFKIRKTGAGPERVETV